MILNKNISVMGFFWTNYLFNRPGLVEDYQNEINKLYLEGKFSPVVSAELPMSGLIGALDTIIHKGAYGKIVLVNERTGSGVCPHDSGRELPTIDDTRTVHWSWGVATAHSLLSESDGVTRVSSIPCTL